MHSDAFAKCVPKDAFLSPSTCSRAFGFCVTEPKAAEAGESSQDAFSWGMMGKALRVWRGGMQQHGGEVWATFFHTSFPLHSPVPCSPCPAKGAL